MTTEQKTVPLWQALKHMQEEEVVYEINRSIYRFYAGDFQHLWFGNWNKAESIYNFPLNTLCILRPDIDYHIGQPKMKQEPVAVDWVTAYADMWENGAWYSKNNDGSKPYYTIEDEKLRVINCEGRQELARLTFNEVKEVKWVKVEKTEETEEIEKELLEPIKPQIIKMTPWAGGKCSFNEDDLIITILRIGRIEVNLMKNIHMNQWEHNDKPEHDGMFDIISCAVIKIEGDEC